MTGHLTIPTDVGLIDETLLALEKWGADAVRDADGTEFPPALAEKLKGKAKVYATYYTTRKDNDWARAHPEEVQQCYIVTPPKTATPGGALSIKLLDGISGDLLALNTRDDISRWWEVVDRTAGEIVPYGAWRFEPLTESVVVENAAAYHEYTAAFLAYIICDPVHMYNAVVNRWKDAERQCTFDVRQPLTHEWSLRRLRKFLRERPYVNVVRFTTFFHQFTLVFDELRREKYVDWYGYSASVSPYILEKFENEMGYKFRPEFIVDEGYYNNQYRIPRREFLDFAAFQRREVAALAKELVDLCHEEGREAMMFLGDHWIGTEPYMDEFAEIRLDAVVGSVGNGQTLRLLSDIAAPRADGKRAVRYTEGRFLPYFFPDTFHTGGNPFKEARDNWTAARRAILRSPVDRIGYGGYLKLALQFPDFVDYIARVADEFREIYCNIKGEGESSPFVFKRVAILNAWGKSRSWGCHMVHHALYQKQNYSYAGVLEALSGAPFEVSFLSFDDIINGADGKENRALRGIDIIVNVGDADTAHGGGYYWADERVITAARRFIAEGGGFIGVGEPAAHQYGGRFFQLADALGVEMERGFTLGYDKYNWAENEHFITEGFTTAGIDFGEGKENVYALPHGKILVRRDKSVQLAASDYHKGRAVYISGLPYSFQNTRLLHRAMLWAAHNEDGLFKWFSENPCVDVHAYPARGKYCAVNNTYEKQSTIIYTGGVSSFPLELDAGGIVWKDM